MCDSLLNIGPCGQVAMGEPAFLSEAFNSSIPDPDIELVTTAGHGKNGALCLLQQSVRPQVRFVRKICINVKKRKKNKLREYFNQNTRIPFPRY